MDENVSALVETVKLQQEQIALMCETFKKKDKHEVVVQQQPRAPDEVRADKIQQLTLALRKSNRIRVYKPDVDINVYLRKFKEEIKTLKHMVGIANDLQRTEYVPIFKSSLDFGWHNRFLLGFFKWCDTYMFA